MQKRSKKKKVLVIVAHPDDETIWMGGTILKNSVDEKIWDTTIISLCRANDKDRAPKFMRVCEKLNAKGFISDLDDEDNEISIDEVISRIKKFADKDYDEVYTHGENGEYSHKRHIETHRAVLEMIKSKQLITKKLFFFDYKKINSPTANTFFQSVPKKNRDNFIKLKSSLYNRKKDLVNNLYGFQSDGFESVCTRNVESFALYKK
jgi:LmbE family N-acetylglucosaminyl deacetylase